MKINNLKNTTKSIGMLLGALILFSSCEGEMEVVQSIDEEFVGIERIEIDSEFMEVNYTGRSGHESVELTGLLESNRSGNFRIDYYQDGSTLYVEMDKKNLIGSGNHRASISLIGPKELALQVNSGSGKIMVSGIEYPELKLNSGSGRIEIFNINAHSIELQASSGSIEGNNLFGNLNAEISSGNIEISQMEGNLNIGSSSGTLDIKRLLGKLNAVMSSGNLQMFDVSEIENLKVSSGKISGTNVGLGPKTKLTSSSGEILIQTNSDLKNFNYDLKAGSGRVIVGDSFSSGSLKIDNGSPITIEGSVSSGRIVINN